jgi:mono/diheme cytochrome c family protein
MNHRRLTTRLLLLLAAFSVSAGLALAQTSPPTPIPPPTATARPVDLICDLEALLDQQRALTAQLESFEADSAVDPGLALDNLFRVGAAYQELALACGYIPPDFAERTVGVDVARIMALLPEVFGDTLNGQLLYNDTYGCAVCHQGESHTGPATEGTYTRVEEDRLTLPQFADYSVTQYLVESIVHPDAYVVPEHANAMPRFYGDQLTLQELADIVAYLESQDGPSPE